MIEMQTGTTRTKQLALSASAIGAAVLGFGMGAKWGADIRAFSMIVIIIGAIIHAYGMYLTQMKNGSQKADALAILLWISAWVCLVTLVAVIIYLSITQS